MIRPPDSFPHSDWRFTAGQANNNDDFVAKCVSLWDAGYDTRAISIKVMQHESVVTSALWKGREARRKSRRNAESDWPLDR